MRIRQIKPSYWSDSALQLHLDAATREFYVGLWMLADDAGWLDWDVPAIGKELYGFQPVHRREKAIERMAEALAALDARHPHLIILDCGHAQVPKIVAHQRFGGRPVYSVRDVHARDCSRLRDDARDCAPLPHTVGNGRVGNGRERKEVVPPPPPALRGDRNGSPRDGGTNPRRNGTSPRQVEREIDRRAPQHLGEIVAGIAAFQAKHGPEAAS